MITLILVGASNAFEGAARLASYLHSRISGVLHDRLLDGKVASRWRSLANRTVYGEEDWIDWVD